MLFVPKVASANIFDFFTHTAEADMATTTQPSDQTNSQKMALVEPNVGPDSTDDNVDPGLLETSITNAALAPTVGPLGSNLDVADIPEGGGQINIYTVHAGDTVGSIAQMFGVTKDTVRNANDLTPGQKLKQGMVLAIPPVSGEIAVAKDGDTITSIAKQYKVDPVDVAIYNDLDVDSVLNAGDTIIIPDVNVSDNVLENKPADNSSTKKVSKTVTKKSQTSIVQNNSSANDSNAGPLTAHPMRTSVHPDLGNALLRPVSLSESHMTQDSHDNGTAVDLGAKIGTPIVASADGTVVLARSDPKGWYGGYGEYVIIDAIIDGNPVQIINAHMSKVLTTVGAQVHRGDIIGEVGETGNATGPHDHFEIHGAINPVIHHPNYTGE